MSEIAEIRIASAGQACDNDRCSVLVNNPDGPRRVGDVRTGCPSCGGAGFPVRFGVAVDDITTTEEQG